MAEPNKSPTTDLLYCRYRPDEVQALAEAMGDKPTKFTAVMLTRERTLFNLCLAEAQHVFHIPTLDEELRGRIINKIAAQVYAKTEPRFTDWCKHHLGNKVAGIMRYVDPYVDLLEKSVHNRPIANQAFDLMWKPERFRHKWQQRAVETYDQIHARSMKGAYTRPPETISKLTKLWSRACIEHREMRRVARELIKTELSRDIHQINHMIDLDPKLGVNFRVKPLGLIEPEKRKTIVFTGGIGCGKSSTMLQWWKKTGHKDSNGFVFLCPDYLKLALALRAKEEGKMTDSDLNIVHPEASNVMYQMMRSIIFNAKGGDPEERSPKDRTTISNVVLETTALDGVRLEGCVAGGAPVDVHCVSADAQTAIASAKEREEREPINKRNIPDEATIIATGVEAVQNIIQLAELRGFNMKLFLYDRTGKDQTPKIVADISMRNSEILIEDLPGFLRIASRSNLDPNPEVARSKFINALLEKRMSLTVLNPGNHEPLCRLNSKREIEFAHSGHSLEGMDVLRGLSQTSFTGRVRESFAKPADVMRGAIRP